MSYIFRPPHIQSRRRRVIHGARRYIPIAALLRRRAMGLLGLREEFQPEFYTPARRKRFVPGTTRRHIPIAALLRHRRMSLMGLRDEYGPESYVPMRRTHIFNRFVLRADRVCIEGVDVTQAVAHGGVLLA